MQPFRGYWEISTFFRTFSKSDLPIQRINASNALNRPKKVRPSNFISIEIMKLLYAHIHIYFAVLVEKNINLNYLLNI